MIGGLYRAGNGPLHRMGPGRKLAVLPIVGTALFLLPSTLLSVAVLLSVLVAYPLAGLPLSLLWRQLRSIAFVLALVALGQVWFAGWEAALLFGARLAALLLLASLITVTTRTSEIVGVLERLLRPMSRLRLDPSRVALALSLTMRFIPLVGAVLSDVREAQAARGAKGSVLQLAVPVIVRLLKTSDEIADAIDARS